MNPSFTSNLEYRKYLQQNSVKIMQTNSNKAFVKLGVYPYNNNELFDNHLKAFYNPYLYQNSYDKTQLTRCQPFSQMKHEYLNKRQLKNRMISPSINLQNFTI